MSQQAVSKKRRLACDRCNSLKLRCPKIQDSQSCTRCLKASAACVFSPSRRGLRPMREQELGYGLNDIPNLHAANETGTSLVLNQELNFTPSNGLEEFLIQDTDFGLTAPPFQDTASNGDGPRTNGNEDAALTERLPDATGVELDWMRFLNDANLGHWDSNTPAHDSSVAGNGAINPQTAVLVSAPVDQSLAELFIDLGKHAATIPPLTIYSCHDAYEAFKGAAKDSFNNGSSTSTHHAAPVFSVVKTFQLTQTLINLYPQFKKTSIRPPSTSKSSHSENSSPQTRNGDSGAGQSPLTSDTTFRTTLDHASIFQMLSCYHRVIDIWDLIFKHIHTGARDEKFTRAFDENSPCQKLRIGGFIPSTKVPMEVVLSIEFLRQILGQARELVDKLASAQHSDDGEIDGDDTDMNGSLPSASDANTEATKSAGIAVTARASDLVEKASHIRDLIEESKSGDP